MNNNWSCRGCGGVDFDILIDLGMSPISNSLLHTAAEILTEARHPLCVVVCSQCGFCQLSEDSDPSVHFHADYVYFSSFSQSWLKHCQAYAKSMTDQLNLTERDLVVELASNDGYLLKYFNAVGVQVLGVEPSANVAAFAEKSNIPTIVDFFGFELSKKIEAKYQKPKLIIGNNVLAHVPNISDFIQGLANLLAEDGIITLEFPHLAQLILNRQFDTIYHEHYSYLSLTALLPIFKRFGLDVFRVEELETHGGSIRLFAAKSSAFREIEASVAEILRFETEFDPKLASVRDDFKTGVARILTEFRNEVVKLNSIGSTVIAFGAAAKGNTLLNAAGITSEQIKFIVDMNPAKQGKLAPGSHIPIVSFDEFKSTNFDVCIILPWNLATEISSIIRGAHGDSVKIMRAIPNLEFI